MHQKNQQWQSLIFSFDKIKKGGFFWCSGCFLQKKSLNHLFNFIRPQNEGLPNAYVPGSLVRDPRGLFTMALRSRSAPVLGSVAWACRSEDAQYERFFGSVCYPIDSLLTPPGPVTICQCCMASQVSVCVLWLNIHPSFFPKKMLKYGGEISV